MTDKLLKGSLVLAVGAILALVAYIMGTNVPMALASAPGGLPATQVLATTTVVGPQSKTTLFPRVTNCTSRRIRTQGTQIYFLYADPSTGDLASTSVSGSAGDFLAASSTATLDGGLFGCGRVIATASASTTVTVWEMQ